MLRPPPTSTLFPYTTLFRSSSRSGSRRARRAGDRAPRPGSPPRRALRGSAPSRQERRAARRTGSPPRSRPSPLLPPLRARLLHVQLVGLDDPLHELVTHDVFVAEA